MTKKLKTLKDIIKATSDYGYPEATNLSDDECKKLNLPTNGIGWNGAYSGEFVRNILQGVAREWIDKLSNDMGIDSDSVRDVCINEMGVLQYQIDEYGKNPHEDEMRCLLAWIKYFFNLDLNEVY